LELKMAKMRFCVLLLTVTSALAWPVAWQGEEQQCPPMNDRLFEAGSSYLLKYSTSVSNVIQGTSHEVTGMAIDCDVLVEAHSDCTLVLKTEKCNLKNLEGDRLPTNRKFSQDMNEHAVIMKMDNGNLVEVFVHENEKVHILNVKRGIMSAIQHDLSEATKVTQPTVNGNCTAVRKVIDRSKAGRVQEVSISTDLNNCTRPDQKAAPLSPTSFFTSVNFGNRLINSSKICSYELREDNVKKITCRESHVMNPFSYDGQRGVMTFITQELKFKETFKINSIFKTKGNMVKKDLLYEFEEQQESTSESNHAAELFERLVRESLDEVQLDTARLFGEFVVNLRTLNYPTLKRLFDNVRSGQNELAKTYMYDAILQCGSIPCFKVMNDLIIDESLPSPISDAIMYVMAFRQYPPLTLIEESLRVAQTHKKQAVLLPLSIMINNYYIAQEEELRIARRLPEPLKESIRLVRDMLGSDCSVPENIQGEERIELNRRILLALKSIGNMGEAVQQFDRDELYTAEQIVPRLKSCIARQDLHHNISVAAIQAFRRFNIPSSDEKQVRNSLFEVLADSSRPVNDRIAAYLMIMRSHPTIANLERVIEIMLDEPLMQLKAFVFSHIENVLESEEPLVQELKRKLFGALGNRQLPEYPKDPLRYSRNVEKSKAFTVPYFNKTLATQIESNFIFEPQHYIPRHIMLNTTLNIFGQSWNVFETAVEMQGFETALEAVFGPMGYFPDDILGTLYKRMDKEILPKIWDAYNFLVEEAKVQVEELRNTPWAELDDVLLAKMQEVKQAVLDKFNLVRSQEESPMVKNMNDVLRQALPAEYETKLNQIHGMIPREPTSPQGSVYVKILGNELGYVSLEDVKSIIPRLDFNLENMQTAAKKYAQEMVEKLAQGVEKNITKSFIFLERDFIIPTSTGLPLNCSVNGTAVLSLRMRAGLGFEAMTMRAFASGRVNPSASIEVIGTMGVNVPILGRAAVMANATTYHASRIEGNVTLNGAHLKLNLNNTNRPMNLFNFSTNFFLIKPDGGLQYIPGIQQDRVEVKKCIGITKQVLGVDLCASWAYPNASYVDQAPRFPITGPTSFNITLVNSDKALKAYTLEFLYKMMKKGGSPGKKTMSMFGKKASQPAEITDVILVNFTAPGETLRREISSLITFNRAKYEAKWNFSVPEMQTYAFAGLLNLKDPKTFTSGFHLVANATAGPDYKASISTTLKNVTTVEKSNYTAVFNASVNELYMADVAQMITTPQSMKLSLTNFYYWDDETPLYQQILFPMYNYRINHEKYRQNMAVVEYENQPLPNEERITDYKLLISLLGQNVTATSHLTRIPKTNVTNTMEVKFANKAQEVPLVFSKYHSVVTEINEDQYQRDFNITVGRRPDSTNLLAYAHRMDITPKEFNNTITVGVQKTKMVLKESFAQYRDWSFLSLYGDRAYTTVPFYYNVSTTLCLRNETKDTLEPTPAIYMAFMNSSVYNPYGPERISFTVSGRVANETALPDNNFSYWTQFNTSVPLLKFKTSTQGAILSSEKDFIIHLNDTTMDLEEKPLLILDSDLVSNTDRGHYISFRVLSPVYNYTFNVTLNEDEEKGWVMGFNSTHNNTLTDLLNMTQSANMTFSRDAMSVNGMFYHPWLQATMTNVLTPMGPIKRFQTQQAKDFAIVAYDRTKELDWVSLKTMVEDVVDNILRSRLELVNTARVQTPSLANVTLDNSIVIDAFILSNVFEFEINRSRCGSGLRVNTSAILDGNGLRSGLSYRVKGRRMPELHGNHTVQIMRVEENKVGMDVKNDFLLNSCLANLTMNGDFQIKRMNRPWNFEVVNGSLRHNLTSRLMNSTFNTGLLLDNFSELTRFDGVSFFLNHNATSKWVNSSLDSGVTFDGFRSLTNFDDITTGLTHSFNTSLANWTTGASFNLRKVNSLFNFERLDAGAKYNMTSRWSNITTGVVYVMDDVRSMFDFNLVDGKVFHNITSPWSVMTTDGAIQLNNFRSMFDFNSISASGRNNMTSGLANWTNDVIVDFSNFRSLFNFERIYLEAGNKMNLTLANATNNGRFEISGVRDLFNFDEVRSSLVHNTNTRWGNWSAGFGMDLFNFVSLFEFEEAIFGGKHMMTSRWYNTTTESEISLRDVRSPTAFQKVIAVMDHNTNTTLGNWTTYSGVTLSEFSSIFNFTSVEAALGHRVDSRYVNWTTDYTMELNDFRAPFQFGLADGIHTTVLNTKWGNMTTQSSLQFDNFRSILDFDAIRSFFHTFVNSSLLNATHSFENEIVNSYGLFAFDRASSKMVTNASSVLGNAELFHGIELNDFENITAFRQINHTVVANVTARHLNTSAFSELLVKNSYCLFNFDKVQHQLRSLIRSRFLNGTMNNDLMLAAFAPQNKFELASWEMLHELSIPFANMSLTQAYAINNMRGFMNFLEGNSSVVYRGMGPLGQLNLMHFDEIKNMNGMQIDFIRVQQEANMTARFLNLTAVHSHVTDQMRSPFSFKRLNVSANYNLSTPLGAVNVYGSSDFNDFKKLFKFRLVNHTGIFNLTSRHMNLTQEGRLAFNNFRRLTSFDLIHGNTTTNFSTPLGKMNATSAVELNDFSKVFEFALVRANNTFNVSSWLLNVSAEHGIEFNNFMKLFTFDRVNGSSRVNVSSPLGMVSNVAEIGFHNFASLFNFDRVNFTNNANTTSRYLNATSRMEVEFNNFEDMLVFDRIRATSNNTLRLPFFNTSAQTEFGMHKFTNLFTFEKMNASIAADLKSKLINTTNEAAVEFYNSAKLFTFERINGTAKTNMSTPIVNTTAVAYIGFHNFNSLLNFSRINSTIEGNVTSRWANLTTSGSMEMRNMTGFNRYELLNGTTRMNFTSKLFNVTSATNMEVNNMTGLMVYDRILANASMNVTGCLVKSNNTISMEVHNMTGFSKFNRIIGNVSSNVNSRPINWTSEHHLEMNEFVSPITFKKVNATSQVNVISPLVETEMKAGVEAHNVNQLVSFDRVNGSLNAALLTFLVNLRANTDFGLHNFISLTHFERATTNLRWDVMSWAFAGNQYSFVTLDNFRGLLNFDEVAASTSMYWNSPQIRSNLQANVNIDRAFNFQQQFEMDNDVTLMQENYRLITRQTFNNERLFFNVTIPGRRSLCLDNYLNTLGDEFVMTLFHTVEEVKTVDLTWLLKLNNTGVIYSNVSWNPETVEMIKSKILEVTRNANETSQDYLQKAIYHTMVVVNETVDIANTTYRLVNYTYYHPREAWRTIREREEVLELEAKMEEAIQKVKDYIQVQKENIKDMINRMDFTTVETTIESFKSLREVRRFQRKFWDAVEMYYDEMVIKYDETVMKLNEMVDHVILLAQDPDYIGNVYFQECFGMTMYEFAVMSDAYSREIGLIALEKSKMIGELALNYTVNVTEWALNTTKNYTELAMVKLNNYTILVYNYTVNMSQMALEYLRNCDYEFIRSLPENVVIYVNIGKDWVLEKTEVIKEVSGPYVTMVTETIEPYQIEAVKYAKQFGKEASKMASSALKRSMELGRVVVKNTKLGYRKGKQYAENARDYIVKISKDPEHVINRYLMAYVTNYTLYQNLDDAYYRLAIKLDEWYSKAEQKYLEYYAKVDELYRDYKVKAEEFALELLNNLETLSKDEEHFLNVYMRMYTKKNMFEVYEVALDKMATLKEELLIIKGQVMDFINKVRRQPLDITKEEVKRFFIEKYEEVLEVIQQFREREDVVEAMETAKSFLHWLNQTRFQPIDNTVAEVKNYLEETRAVVIAYIEDIKQREDVQNAIQKYNDFLAREDVDMTLTTIKTGLLWANQTRFQPLEQTRQEIIAFLEEKLNLLRDEILAFPVEANVQKLIIYIEARAEETRIFIVENYNLAKEKYAQLEEFTLEKYEQAKEFSLEQWRYLKEETPYVQKAEELLEKMKELMEEYRMYAEDKLEYSREYALMMMDTTVETTNRAITYVNGTMAGWFIRYYELNQLPLRLFDRYITFVYGTPETLSYIVSVVYEEIPNVMESGWMLVDNGLNTVGRVGAHSYAMNISHPLAWASFRQTPDLTEDQWAVIMETKEMLEANVIEPSITKIKEWLEIANETQNKIQTYIKEVYVNNKPMIEQRLEQLKQKILELKQNISEEYKQLPTLDQLRDFDQLAQKYPILLDIKDNLTEIKRKVQEKIPTVEEIKENFNELKQRVQETIPTLEEIQDKWVVLRRDIEGNWNVFKLNVEDKWVLYRDYIEGNFTQLKNYIVEEYPVWKKLAQEKLMDAMVKIKEVYELVKTEYPNAPEHFKNLIADIKTKANELREKVETELPILLENTKNLAIEYYNFAKERYPVYVENLQAFTQDWIDFLSEQYPIYLEKAETLIQEWIEYIEERYPTYVQKVRETLEDLRNRIETEYPQYREKIEQGIEKIKELLEYLNLVRRQIVNENIQAIRNFRPFNSETDAMIFGDRHVLTFDKHLYEHPGYVNPNCAYVLATDYIDNNFTLFSTESNIILSLRGLHVTIAGDNVVFVDGSIIPLDIPYQTDDITITHVGPWVNVTSIYGIKLNCNSHRFLCKVSLSSWYHGKTRGLLGNLDREARTDRVKPDGRNSTGLIDFVNAYEVTGRQECQINRFNYPDFAVAGCNYNSQVILEQQCMEYFSGEESPLRAAFEVVSPTEWRQECIRVAQQCKDICTVTGGYVELARNKDILVIDPCEQCNDNPKGSEWIENKVVYGADVVFVVSENKRFQGEETLTNLKSLVNNVESTLRGGQMTNNRYGLVAFGGLNIHAGAHPHTIYGRLINTAPYMPYGLESLAIEGDYPTDAFDAIKLASEYTFRPGAAKMVVLIVESEREYEESYYTLTDIQQFLTRRGVTLYVVSNYTTLQKKSTVGIKFDNTMILTKKAGSDKVTKNLDIPRGDYAKLAIATRGSIFRLDMLLEGDDDLQTTLSKTLRNDADRILAGEVDRQCTCVINHYGLATVECQNIWI